MLTFNSASVRIADSTRAIEECAAILYGNKKPETGGLWIINAGIGHKLDKVAEAIRAQVPGTTVVGCSCGGVIGREGVSEALTSLAVMNITGPENEYGIAGVENFHAANAYVKGLDLAKSLYSKVPNASIIFLLSPGLDSCHEELIKAFEEVYGKNIVIFGGASSDNYKAKTMSHYIGSKSETYGAIAVGLADPTIKSSSRATHGFHAFGEPMIVTKAIRNQIEELDGMPAIEAYRKRIGDISDSEVREALVSGGLAFDLPDSDAAIYGNKHILRMGLPNETTGAFWMSVTAKTGDKVYMTSRDEDLIFSEQKRVLDDLRREIVEKTHSDNLRPIAVFQTDCLLRGRALFDKVMKDEIISMIQSALQNEGETPPWLGMYGFGEFCPLGGKNVFHTYTTSLLVLYR